MNGILVDYWNASFKNYRMKGNSEIHMQKMSQYVIEKWGHESYDKKILESIYQYFEYQKKEQVVVLSEQPHFVCELSKWSVDQESVYSTMLNKTKIHQR